MPRALRGSIGLAALAASSLLFACRGGEAAPPRVKVVKAEVVAPAPPAVPEAPKPSPEAAAATAEKPAVPPRPLAPPGKLTAAAQSDSEVALSWQASPEATGYEVFRGDALAAKVKDTHAVDRGLRHGANFCYTVQAFDASGNESPKSPAACAQTLDTTPPSVPPKLQVAGRPGNQVVVSWSPSTDDVGVTSYQVMRGNEFLASVVGATSLSVNGVPPAKEQCYTVHALDRAGNRSPPAGPACITLPDVTPPTVPGHVVASARGEQEVALAWEASVDDVGVARYEVLRSTPGQAQAASVPAEGTAARDRGLAAATRYCYAIRACDAAGNCSAAAPEACATTPDLTPPSSPKPVVAKALSDTEVEVRWTASTDNVGVAGYEIRRGERLVATAKETYLHEGALKPAQEYCYRVVAFDAAGNRSPPSSPACARPPDLKPPSTPERVAAVSVSSTQMFVAWDPSTDDVGVAGYEVLRGTGIVDKAQTTRARERSLKPNQEYCYTVVAFDAAGNRSPPSKPACATTADPSQIASPSDLRVVRASPTIVLLQWEPSEQKGVLYRIYAQGKSVGLTNGNTYTPSGRLGAKPDCFRVAAVDAEGHESPRSNEVCAKATATAAAVN